MKHDAPKAFEGEIAGGGAAHPERGPSILTVTASSRPWRLDRGLRDRAFEGHPPSQTMESLFSHHGRDVCCLGDNVFVKRLMTMRILRNRLGGSETIHAFNFNSYTPHVAEFIKLAAANQNSPEKLLDFFRQIHRQTWMLQVLPQ